MKRPVLTSTFIRTHDILLCKLQDNYDENKMLKIKENVPEKTKTHSNDLIKRIFPTVRPTKDELFQSASTICVTVFLVILLQKSM